MSSLSLGLLLCCVVTVFGASSRYHLKGKLLCNGEPMKDVKLKLMDRDGGFILNGNDKLDETLTSEDGTFRLAGDASDVGSKIDPYFKLYHRCNVGFGRCAIKMKWNLPADGFVGTRKTYDFGIFDLAVRTKDTEHDCSH